MTDPRKRVLDDVASSIKNARKRRLAEEEKKEAKQANYPEMSSNWSPARKKRWQDKADESYETHRRVRRRALELEMSPSTPTKEEEEITETYSHGGKPLTKKQRDEVRRTRRSLPK